VTARLIDARLLNCMKRDAILINRARDETVGEPPWHLIGADDQMA
jgi:lactate dehydrogenase-like 2-hydroxyacid dehydrogenase